MTIRCFRKKLWFIFTAIICFLLLHFSLPGDFEHSLSYLISIKSRKPIVYTKSQQHDPCSGRYIYMYDLSPKFNQNLVKNCKTLRKDYNFCRFVENQGFGSKFEFNYSSETSENWYATHQFILDVIFHTRMKQYECLTSDSSLASAFYAPFYIGLEATQHLWGGYSSSVKDAEGLDFTTWLKGRSEWSRLYGRDHFIMLGRITWDFRRPTYMGPDWGTTLMNLPEIRNMTVLTVDSSPHSDTDFSVPYPTYFHPSNDYELLQWQKSVRDVKRDHLFAFAGAPRPNQDDSIRGELITQCKNASKNHCKLVSCAPDNIVNCISPDYILSSFLKSDFCLQPPGDSDTRRSTFDAILAGCIPVFFHPGSAYTQYYWHLPKNYTSYSVFIPLQGIKNGSVSVEEFLLRFSQDDISTMREEVIRLIPSIIYARNKLEKTEDAFDISIKGVLQRIEDFRRDLQEGKDPRKSFPEESTWKYYLTGKTEDHEWDSFFKDHQI